MTSLAVKKSNPKSFVESKWKPVLGQVEKSRLRRGKAMRKAGDVTRLVMKNNVVHATVRNAAARGTVEVTMTVTASFAPHLSHVATWFALRLDWLAAWLSGEWPDEMIDLFEKSGLHLFPRIESSEQATFQVSCTCSDWESICAHGAAVMYAVISEVESRPIKVLEYAGVSPDEFLSTVHRLVAKRVTEQLGMTKQSATESGRVPLTNRPLQSENIFLWPEETMYYDSAETSRRDKWNQPRVTPVLRFDANETLTKGSAVPRPTSAEETRLQS